MANEQNLRPFFSPSEAREAGRKGGKKSAEARRRKKSIAKSVEAILFSAVNDEKQLAAIKKAGLPVGKKPTYADFLTASILLRTIQKGKVEDLQKIMEIIGEQVRQQEEAAEGSGLMEALRGAAEVMADGDDAALLEDK